MPVQIDMEMPRSCLDCRFCIEESYGGANSLILLVNNLRTDPMIWKPIGK